MSSPEHSARWRERHPERIKQARDRWAATHREQLAANNRAYRSRVQGDKAQDKAITLWGGLVRRGGWGTALVLGSSHYRPKRGSG
jgi:hypothetical protein